MKLILQKERWTCGVIALAMLLDEDPEELIQEIGHNGGVVAWPELNEPLCYRGFHTQEFVDICFDRGYALIEVIAQPICASLETVQPVRVWDAERENNRISQYMEGNPGIIIGALESGNRHAVAWDGTKVYDPRGHIYNFNSSEPEYSIGDKSFYPIAVSEFLMLIKIKSS